MTRGVTETLRSATVLLAVVVAAAALLMLLPAVLFGLSYLVSDLSTEKCTDAERHAFAEIRHYVPLEARRPAEHAGCDGAFTTTDRADDVIAHYQDELVRLGWRIEDKTVDRGPWPPPPADGDEMVAQHRGGGGDLRAQRGAFSISIEYAPGWLGTEDGEWQRRGFVHVWLDERRPGQDS
jgi:hypothetical protein